MMCAQCACRQSGLASYGAWVLGQLCRAKGVSCSWHRWKWRTLSGGHDRRRCQLSCLGFVALWRALTFIW